MTPTYKVLIVDAIQKTAQIISSILSEESIDNQIAITKDDACLCVQNWMPDLIIVDISTIELEGFEICEKMKSMHIEESIPIIYIASKTNAEDILRAFRSGVVDYIIKPFESQEFIARIKTHLQLILAKRQIQSQNIKLQELNSIKDRLFSIIAHDLRGPLGNFRSILDIAIKHVEHNPAAVVDLLHAVKESAYNTYALLENLLHWARTQQNQIKLSQQVFDFSELAHDTFNLFILEANKKKIQFANKITGPLLCIADKDMIYILLRNLVSNAIKFTTEGERVIMESSVENNSIKISVVDSGLGIPEEQLAKLFDKSYHESTWGTNFEKGTGLGLQLCNDIINLHNQTLTVESKEGEGTTFTFTLQMA